MSLIAATNSDENAIVCPACGARHVPTPQNPRPIWECIHADAFVCGSCYTDHTFPAHPAYLDGPWPDSCEHGWPMGGACPVPGCRQA